MDTDMYLHTYEYTHVYIRERDVQNLTKETEIYEK